MANEIESIMEDEDDDIVLQVKFFIYHKFDFVFYLLLVYYQLAF